MPRTRIGQRGIREVEVETIRPEAAQAWAGQQRSTTRRGHAPDSRWPVGVGVRVRLRLRVFRLAVVAPGWRGCVPVHLSMTASNAWRLLARTSETDYDGSVSLTHPPRLRIRPPSLVASERPRRAKKPAANSQERTARSPSPFN